jgi:hypothetical protein
VKIPFIIIFIVTILTSCAEKREVWTVEYEQQVSVDLDHSLLHRVRDSSKRREMVVHVIKQLKKELPDGLESVSAVTLHVLTNKLEQQYALSKGQPHTSLPWTDVNEENLRLTLIEQYAKEVPNETLRMAYCNCMIAHLKSSEPDSLRIPISDTILTSLMKACPLK